MTESKKIVQVDFQGNGTASVKSGKKVTHFNVKGRDYVHRGTPHTGPVHYGHHIEIIPGVSVRVFGKDMRLSKETKNFEETNYSVTFKVGDTAVYDAYNYKYLGIIEKITAKAITIRPEVDGGVKRLDLYTFSRKNAFFNLETIQAHNAETSQTI